MKDFDEIQELKIGCIIEVTGTSLTAKIDGSISELTRSYNGRVYSVGQIGSIVKVHFGQRVLFGFVGSLRMNLDTSDETDIAKRDEPPADQRVLQVDLFAEGIIKSKGLDFQRGVKTYPLPGQNVYIMTKSELTALFEAAEGNKEKETKKASMLSIGTYANAQNVDAKADIDKMFGLHCAVLGSTGSGKSSAVSALIHAVLEAKGSELKPRIVIIDPHGEYKEAFGEKAQVYRAYSSITPEQDDGAKTIKLPCWLMSSADFRKLVIGKTEQEATSQNNMVMRALRFARMRHLELVNNFKNHDNDDAEEEPDIPDEKNDEANAFDIDRPIPFLAKDWDKHILKVQAERKTTGEKKGLTSKGREQYDHLKNKLKVLLNDTRLDFLMDEIEGTKSFSELADILAQFAGGDTPIKIIDLSGLPNEVAGILTAVIGRLLFQYKLYQTTEEREKDPMLLVCEEAHRYVSDSTETQYAEAQTAIRRIAKEGRKYGIGLMLVSQRPADIESTVISQCNTWLVLRLTNGTDQSRVAQFLPDTLGGLTKILPSLGRQEALFVGEGAVLPARIRIRDLEDNQKPKSADMSFSDGWRKPYLSNDEFKEIAGKMSKTAAAINNSGNGKTAGEDQTENKSKPEEVGGGIDPPS